MQPKTNKFIIVSGEESIQGSDAWKNFRKDKIGASEVAAILGVSPWETALELFNRKILEKDITTNSAMRRGSELEPKARQILYQMTMMYFEPCVLQSVENPKMVASLDGMYVDGYGTHIAEIKCPGEAAHRQAILGKIPEYYIPQLCYQCMIAGVESCTYVSWDGHSEEAILINYERDMALSDKILHEVTKFIERWEDFNPPEEKDRDWVQEDSDDLVARANRYEYLCQLSDEISSEMEYLKESIISKMSHPKTVVGNLKVQKLHRVGVVDYSSIPELKGLDLQKYRKEPREYWKISARSSQ